MIVASLDDARRLARELEAYSLGTGYPAGVDTETTGCNPKAESPVGRARVWCATVAWGAPGQEPQAAFILRRYLEPLIPWLEDPDAGKVGNLIYGYDRHAFKNEGIELRGIEGDVKYMAKLLDPSQLQDCGLKAMGEAIGFKVESYKDVTARPAHGPVMTQRSKFSHCPWCDWVGERVRKICDGCGFVASPDLHVMVQSQRVYWGKREIIPLDELWSDYPERREAFARYAVRDAVMSLAVFYAKQAELEGVPW